MVSNEKPILSAYVEDELAKKYGLFIYEKSTKILFIPGAIYVFLFFFLINLFLVQQPDRILIGAIILSALTTLFIEFIFWILRKIGMLYLKRKIHGYTLDFFPDRIVKTKNDSTQIGYQKKNIQNIKHFSDFDIIYYKENNMLLKKEIIIPYKSLKEGQKDVYGKIIATFE